MGKKTVTGTTKQSARTTGEKKQREKPPRLSETEKLEKHGNKKNVLNYKLKFNSLTETQEEYYETILEKRVTFGTGVAGSGKSFVCLSAALRLLKEDNCYKQILIITPTVEAGNMKLGFLPGSKAEKIEEYLEADFQTLTDILEISGNDNPEGTIKALIESNFIHGDCVNFMRGKTLKNKIVIITEAENFSKQEMFLLLSRIHPTSKYIINGDNRQQDRKDIDHNQQNGLKHAMNTLKGNLLEVGFSHFKRKDIVRDPLIEKIMDFWFEGTEQDDEY